MFSADIPKTVSIIVKHAENLEYTVPGSKKSAKSRRWCVVFIGGKKKMVTHTVDSQEGCPVWDCEVSIDLVSPTDPLVMLVLDAERRHIGQVVIPLAQIPRNGPPNFDPSRLQYSELEPTKKNSTPHGRLVYWIWATSYWPPGTKLETKSKSFRGSLSHIGRSRSKHQIRGPPSFSVGNFNDPNAAFSSDGKSSRAPSMVSGAYSESNMSGGASFYGIGHSDPLTTYGGANEISSIGTWNPPQSGSRIGTLGSSYNPLDETGSLAGSTRLGSEAGDAEHTLRPPLYQSSFNLGPNRSNNYAESSISGRSGKPRGLMKKMRNKLSRSTQNLTLSAAKKAGGEKLYGDQLGSVLSLRSTKNEPQFPDSTSKLRPPTASVLSFSRDSYPPDGSTKPNGEESSHKPEAASVLRSDAPGGVCAPLLNSQQSIRSSAFGLHPEEQPIKPLEEMSHRELMNYAMQLERSSHVTRAELLRVQGERDEFSKKATSAEDELQTVRNTLADLRFRLLAAGLTEYLELPPSPGKPNCLRMNSVPFTDSQDWKPRSSTYNDNTAADGYQTFFNKLTALASNTRKFGQNGALEAPVATAPTASTDWW